ncbi:MAG: S8 family serine peptidase [Hellea sp.]|nr:S8 family serine peptidase [Hellea sp.]
MKLRTALLTTAMLCGFATSAQAQFVPPIETIDNDGNRVQLEAEQYIIKYRSKAKMAVSDQIGEMHGLMDKSIDDLDMLVAVLPKSEVMSLKHHPDVEYVEVDPRRYPMAEEVPYGITMVEAPLVSDANTGNQKVCVIDTGYEISHIDLPASNLTGNDFGTATGPWNTDGDGHGSHVAGTIAALGGNNEGVVGVNPGNNLPLHIVKIFNDNGDWTNASDLIVALNHCANAGATVVNMSLGGGGSSNAEETAFNNAYANGIISVAAAGNDGNGDLSYPASYDNVISVGAVNSAANHGSYSQFNYQVELAAPGTSVKSTTPGNTYSNYTGTSMATPHVAGVTALVWSHYPSCTPVQIRSTLAATALDRGDPGRDILYGLGIVQAKAAFDMLASGCDTAPEIEIPEPPQQPTFDPEMFDGVPKQGMAGLSGQFYRFYIDVPSGATNLNFVMSGGSGDADLYVSHDVLPTRSSFDCRSWEFDNNETCTFAVPNTGRYHVYVYSYATFENVDIVATFDGGNVPNQPPINRWWGRCTGLDCEFFANQSSDPDGTIVSYFWKFESGVPGKFGNPNTYTFPAPGTYRVLLTIKDDDGAKAKKRRNFVVPAPQ